MQRVSYSLPPPNPSTPRTIFRLPSLSESHSSKLSRTGPLLLPLDGQDDLEGTRSREDFAKGIGKAQDKGHPRHALAVTSLALDLTTTIERPASSLYDSPSEDSEDDDDGDSDDRAQRRQQAASALRPRGILYSGGRDGLTASWDLNLKMRPRSSSPRQGRDRRHGREKSGADPMDVSPVREPTRADDGDADGMDVDAEGIYDMETGAEDDTTAPGRGARSSLPGGRIFRKDAPSHLPGVRSGLSRSLGGEDSAAAVQEWETVQPFWKRWKAGWSAKGQERRRTKTSRIGFRQCVQSHSDWVNDVALCNHNQTCESGFLR